MSRLSVAEDFEREREKKNKKTVCYKVSPSSDFIFSVQDSPYSYIIAFHMPLAKSLNLC